MQFRYMTLAAIFSGFALPALAAESLTLDAENSKIEFVGAKSDGNHDGGFKKFKAAAVADFEEPANSSLKIDIDATSLWSDNAKLTNHLKNPDFFDVRKYPTITFESTEIIPGEEGKATIAGKMTMLDKTVQVAIPVTAEADEEQLTLTGSFSIDRTKWGMNYGEGKIDDEVKVETRLVFKR